MTEQELQKLIETAKDFPSLSQIAAELVQLTRELSVPVNQVAQLLHADQPLLNKMLLVINSPFYRFAEPIAKIDQAISLMGYRRICNLAVSLSLMDQFPPGQEREFDHAQFWGRAICNAISAGEISAHIKEKLPEEAFTVGFLQDVGSLLLAHLRPLGYGRSQGLAQGKELHPANAEREALGIDHAVAGALLCAHWHLSERVSAIIRHHHFFETADPVPRELERAAQVANLASLITDVLHAQDTAAPGQRLYERAQDLFGFGPPRVDDILETISVQVQKLRSSFAIPTEEEEAEAPDAALFFEFCPKCGAPGSSKFCKDCGANLEVTARRAPLSSDKILIAEDSAATRLALSILIRRLGYAPVEALNGIEALRMARTERPGMILMDIQMPGMSGLEALQTIRREREISHIPVVMLTSITSADIVVEALQAGANDYVVKPFTAAIIQDRVHKHMGDQA